MKNYHKEKNSAHSFTEGMFVATPPVKIRDPDKLRTKLKSIRDIKDGKLTVTEESQEDLWKEFEDSYLYFTMIIENGVTDPPTMGVTKAGKEQFTITRKSKRTMK